MMLLKLRCFFVGAALQLSFIAAKPVAAVPLKIGVTLGLTGPADKWAAFNRRGMELAAKELSTPESPVKLVFEDTRSEPAVAVTALKKLIEIDGVTVVIGDVFSYVVESYLPLAEQKNVLVVSPSTPRAACSPKYPNLFSTASQVADASTGFRDFLSRFPKIKRVALIYFDDPTWGQIYRDNWRKVASQAGVTITGEIGSADFKPDFGAILPKMLAAKPDAFFVAHDPKTFIQTVRRLGFAGTVVFANNLLELFADPGLDPSFLKNVYLVDTDSSEQFKEAFRKMYGLEPVLEPQNGYEAVHSAVMALRANLSNPAAAMKTLSYVGIAGPISFSDSCAGSHADWFLKELVEGAYKKVR